MTAVALTVGCLVAAVYSYLGYPVALYVLAKLFGNEPKRDEELEPTITLIVSCYNEVDVVAEKIENCLALAYPKEKLDFIFVSDGSDDGTDAVIAACPDPRVRLIRQEGRLGKTSGLNLAMQEVSGALIVFSDANALYEANALRMLTRNFAEPSVGYVVGAALYSNQAENEAAESENVYWKYELFLKQLESRLHSVVGGDGAIYAIRAELYRPLEREDINDFVNPLQIVARGFRGVFEPEAICYEDAAASFDKEFRRKKRIVNRSFRGLMSVASVMNPGKVGFFAFEIVSHKLLRWLVPLFLLGAAAGVLYLASSGSAPFKLLLLGGVCLVWLAVGGFMMRRRASSPPYLYYPYYFALVNIASALGVINALAGEVQVTWDTARASGTEGASDYSTIATVVAAAAFTALSFFALGVGTA